MGIQGLLPLLRCAFEDSHVQVFAGQTVAVDTYSWLHKGAYACAMELIEGKIPSSYIAYTQRRIEMLQANGVTPLLVFDGQNLPSKASTEEERRRSREANRAMAAQLLREGKKKEANECFQKCVNITPEIAYEVIKLCRRMGVAYVVAPYEADAQMSYLYRSGKVQGIITEDSDLIAFGCDKILFKMDPMGHGQLFIRSKLRDSELPHDVDLCTWDDDAIMRMCILSGCDYLPSIHGIGLKKAYQLLAKNRQDVKLVIRFLRMKGQSVIPPDYLAHFRRAEHTFHHQRVYDMDTCTCRPLEPFPEEEEGEEGVPFETRNVFVGPPVSDDIAQGIATGRLNPLTLDPMPEDPPENSDTSEQNTDTSTHSSEQNGMQAGRPTSQQKNSPKRGKPTKVPKEKSNFQWGAFFARAPKKTETISSNQAAECEKGEEFPVAEEETDSDSGRGSSSSQENTSPSPAHACEDVLPNMTHTHTQDDEQQPSPAPVVHEPITIEKPQPPTKCLSRFFAGTSPPEEEGEESGTEAQDTSEERGMGWGAGWGGVTRKRMDEDTEEGNQVEDDTTKRMREEDVEEEKENAPLIAPNALQRLQSFSYGGAKSNPPRKQIRLGLSRSAPAKKTQTPVRTETKEATPQPVAVSRTPLTARSATPNVPQRRPSVGLGGSGKLSLKETFAYVPTLSKATRQAARSLHAPDSQ